MDNLIFWGEILRKARVARNLTQKEVAAVLHISRQTYSSYETGRTHPTPEMIAILSNIYDINLFEQIMKYLPEEYVSEQHEFKYSMPSSPDITSGRYERVRKKIHKIFPENIEFDD